MAITRPLPLRDIPARDEAPLVYRRSGIYAIRTTTSTVEPVTSLHTEVELVLVLSGRLRYFVAGQSVTARPGRLRIFWGGLPHRAVEIQPFTELLGMHIPLSWVTTWALPNGLTTRLLRGESLEEPDPGLAAQDRALVAGWVDDLTANRPEVVSVVALELRARLSRLAIAVECPDACGPYRNRASTTFEVERAAQYIGEHFREPLTVASTAAALGLQPNYLMRLFKRSCGLSVWEYVVMVRVAQAQRLLAGTALPVLEVAMESGFGSAAQFYSAFRRCCAMSPGRYRAEQRLADPG